MGRWARGGGGTDRWLFDDVHHTRVTRLEWGRVRSVVGSKSLRPAFNVCTPVAENEIMKSLAADCKSVTWPNKTTRTLPNLWNDGKKRRSTRTRGERIRVLSGQADVATRTWGQRLIKLFTFPFPSEAFPLWPGPSFAELRCCPFFGVSCTTRGFPCKVPIYAC